MTSDLWTANTTSEPFITMTCHCIIDFELFDFVLSTRSFNVAHTAENITTVLCASTSLWNLDGKTVGFVTDNASNITNAVENSYYDLVRCHAHTLQLCIKDSLKQQPLIENLLTKCRKLVGHFKHSSTSRRKLTEIQKRNTQFSQLKFIQEVKRIKFFFLFMFQTTSNMKNQIYLSHKVETRWNST